MDPRTEIETSSSPPSSSPSVFTVDANLMNMTLSDLFSRLQKAESEEARLKGELGKKAKEIYLLHERIKFESFDRRKFEEELKEQHEKSLKEKEEGFEKSSGKLKTKIRELGEELKKREEECEETKKLLEDGKRKEKVAEDVISELKWKIGELEDDNREHEQTWKTKFLELEERISILRTDFIEASKKDANDSDENDSHVIISHAAGATDEQDKTSRNGLAPLSKEATIDVNGSLKRKFESRNILDDYDIYVSSTSSSSSSECDGEEILRSCSRLLGDSIHQSKKR